MINIIDINNKPVTACAQFDYKGYTVSISTIFKGGTVGVFKDGKDDKYFNDVDKAINYIVHMRLIQLKNLF